MEWIAVVFVCMLCAYALYIQHKSYSEQIERVYSIFNDNIIRTADTGQYLLDRIQTKDAGVSALLSQNRKPQEIASIGVPEATLDELGLTR